MANRERIIALLRQEQKEIFDSFEEAIAELTPRPRPNWREKKRQREAVAVEAVQPAEKKPHWTKTPAGVKKWHEIVRANAARNRKK